MSKRFKAKVEKLCPHDNSPRYRKFLKQRSHRVMRRWAKRDPERAPRKLPHVGWSI